MITEGDNAKIICEAIGYPPPTIMWSSTNGILSDRVSVSDNISVLIGNGNVMSVSVNLTLTNANREDTGLYECFASNGAGSDVKNTSVTVQCKLYNEKENMRDQKMNNQGRSIIHPVYLRKYAH